MTAPVMPTLRHDSTYAAADMAAAWGRVAALRRLGVPAYTTHYCDWILVYVILFKSADEMVRPVRGTIDSATGRIDFSPGFLRELLEAGANP